MIFSCVVFHCHLSCLWIDLFMTLHLFKASKHNKHTHTLACRSVCVTERWCVWIRAVRLTADENNIYCVNSFRRCRNIRCEEITRETPHSSQLKGNYGIDFKHTEWKQSTFIHPQDNTIHSWHLNCFSDIIVSFSHVSPLEFLHNLIIYTHTHVLILCECVCYVFKCGV